MYDIFIIHIAYYFKIETHIRAYLVVSRISGETITGEIYSEL